MTLRVALTLLKMALMIGNYLLVDLPGSTSSRVTPGVALTLAEMALIIVSSTPSEKFGTHSIILGMVVIFVLKMNVVF